PMHAHADLLRSAERVDPFGLLAAFNSIHPCIDAVKADFTSGSSQTRNFGGDMRNIIAGRARFWSGATLGLSRPPFKRDNEERRWLALFQFNIAVELKPEILGQSGLDQRRLRRG